jgi:hypothetical protein
MLTRFSDGRLLRIPARPVCGFEVQTRRRAAVRPKERIQWSSSVAVGISTIALACFLQHAPQQRIPVRNDLDEAAARLTASAE